MATIQPGVHLGPYEILSQIGEGGMGQVWKARDTRLDRNVAIKVSKEKFSERFGREARAVAALNHPNICTLHDVGPNYLVMEMVEGPTIAERLQHGPIPLDEAIVIARQIGSALEAAHEKAIIHRDLKPGNIKITPSGTVKVLDFGLAKMAEGETNAATNTDDTPTFAGATETNAAVVLRHASVHGARAGARHSGGQACRYLGFRCGAVSNDHRTSGVRRRIGFRHRRVRIDEGTGFGTNASSGPTPVAQLPEEKPPASAARHRRRLGVARAGWSGDEYEEASHTMDCCDIAADSRCRGCGHWLVARREIH